MKYLAESLWVALSMCSWGHEGSIPWDGTREINTIGCRRCKRVDFCEFDCRRRCSRPASVTCKSTASHIAHRLVNCSLKRILYFILSFILWSCASWITQNLSFSRTSLQETFCRTFDKVCVKVTGRQTGLMLRHFAQLRTAVEGWNVWWRVRRMCITS